VSSVTTTRLEPDRSEGQIQVIMNDYDIINVNSIIFKELSDRGPAKVHERLRLDQQNRLIGNHSFSEAGIKAHLTNRDTVCLGQPIQDQKPQVMTG
jgi:hypothetical protein